MIPIKHSFAIEISFVSRKRKEQNEHS